MVLVDAEDEKKARNDLKYNDDVTFFVLDHNNERNLQPEDSTTYFITKDEN